MGMKVCKLVRLTVKGNDGLYVNSKEGRVTLRSKAVVSEESVKESEGNFGTTGLLYIVDAKATSDRDAEVEAEVNDARGINAEPKAATL